MKNQLKWWEIILCLIAGAVMWEVLTYIFKGVF